MCTGGKVWKGYLKTLLECQVACTGVSDLLAYGTTKYGSSVCHKAGCPCYCETMTSSRLNCEQSNNTGYILYRLPGNIAKSCSLIGIIVYLIEFLNQSHRFFKCNFTPWIKKNGVGNTEIEIICYTKTMKNS